MSGPRDQGAPGPTSVVIGLSAVVVAIRDGEAVVLTVRPHDAVTDAASPLPGLPFGPFDPAGHRTFELGLRAFVTSRPASSWAMWSSSTPSGTRVATRRAPRWGPGRPGSSRSAIWA